MTGARAALCASLVFAIIFAAVSMILGFGPILSIASAVIGAISGSSFIARSTRGFKSSSVSVAGMEKVFKAGFRKNAGRRFGASNYPSSEGFGKLLGRFSRIFAFESPFQRVACCVFCVQALLGLVAILAFWVLQAAGADTSALDNPSVARLFSNAFPTENASEIAKVRFHHLFVPLVSLYAISLGVFAVAFIYSFGAALSNVGKHVPVILFIALVMFCLGLVFFYAGSSPSGLKRLIIQGDMWGYFGLFVLMPIFCLVLTAALPNSQAR